MQNMKEKQKKSIVFSDVFNFLHSLRYFENKEKTSGKNTENVFLSICTSHTKS